MSDSIKVAIRVRPLISREKDNASEIHWKVADNVIRPKDPNAKPFMFDRVFDQLTTTSQVYKDIAQSIVLGVMEGFNGTIFAYGQTASGKTFTMMGDSKTPGVISLAIKDIFNAIENTVDREYLIRVAYLEIYNEQVCDLLGDAQKHLDVREGAGGTVYVENLKEELVNCEEQILALMKKGENNRHYGHTKMNDRSSRSHTIFQLTIESRERVEDHNTSYDGVVKVSTLNLVDLAGSEKAKHTGATGQRLMEGGFINKSLFVLSQVISQLSEGSPFINYRDSRLTRILQNSLGGNSQTTIICNCTPASQEETLSTLRFATNAKRIKNKPVLNEVMSDGALLKRYKTEMHQLRRQLDEMKLGDVNMMREENEGLQQLLAEKERLQKLQEEKINKLKEFICVSSRPTVKENKKKRRETWCPGKARMSMAPGAMMGRTLDLAARIRFPSAEMDPDVSVSSTFVTSRSRSEDHSLRPLPSLTEGEEFHSFSSDSGKRHVHFGATECILEPMSMDVECQTEFVPMNSEDDGDNLEMELLRTELSEKNQRIGELMRRLEALEGNTPSPSPAEAGDQTIKDLQDEVSRKTAECARLQQTLDDNLLYSTSRQRELQEEIDMLKECVREAADTAHKFDELQEKHNTLQAEFQETFTFSSGVIDDLSQTRQAKESVMKELDRLSIAYERLTEELAVKETELLELQEFTRVERDFKNESIMEKNEMREKLTELQSQHTDFDVHLELERNKYKHRERELTDQLEAIYEENYKLRKSSSTSIHESTPADIRRSSALRRSAVIRSTASDESVDENGAVPVATVSALEELGIYEDPDGAPDASTSGHEDLHQEVQRLTQQLAEMTELHAASEMRLQQLAEQLTAAQQLEATQKEEIEALKQQQERPSVPGQEQETSELEVVTALQKDLENARTKITELEASLKQKQDEIAKSPKPEVLDLQSELMMAQQNYSVMHDLDVTDLNSTTGSTLARHLNTTAGDASSGRLQQELEQAQSDLEHAYLKIIELETQVEEAQQAGTVEGGVSEADLQTAKERISELEKLLAETQADTSEKLADEELQKLRLDLEKAQNDLEESKSHVATLEDLLRKKEEESDTAVKPEDEVNLSTIHRDFEQAQSDLEEAYMKVTELEASLEEKQQQLDQQTEEHTQQAEALQEKLQVLEEQHADIQRRADESTEEANRLKNQLCEKDDQLEQLRHELTTSQERASDLEASVASTDNAQPTAQLKHLQKEYDTLLDRYSQLESITSTTKGRLLCEENRDLDLQKQLENLEKVHKDFKTTYAQTTKENQEAIAELEKQVYELMCQLQKSRGECELAQHHAKKTADEKEVLKGELRTLETMLEQHESRGRQQNMDPDKMMDRIKKLGVSLDLTNQRCQNYEAKIKQLEASEAKNGDAVFQRNNLQVEVRELQHSLKEKLQEMSLLQQRYSNSHMEISDLRLQVDSLQRQVDLNMNADYPNQLKQSQHLVKELETKLSTAHDRLLQAENAVQAAEGRVGSHKQETVDLQRELQACKNDMNRHEDQLKTQEETISGLQKELQAAMEMQRKAEEKAKMATAQAEEIANAGDAETEQLRSELEKAQQELCECQCQLKAAQEHQAQAEEDARVAAAEAADAVKGGSEELERLRGELEVYQQQNREQSESYQQQLSQQEARVTDLQQQAVDLHQQLAEAQAEAQAAASESAEAAAARDAEIEKLKEQLAASQRDLCEVREQLECDKKQVSELETMLKSAEQLQAQAEEDARAAASEAVEAVAVSEAEMDKLRQELDSYKKSGSEQVQYYSERVEELESQLQDSRQNVSSLESELQAVTSRAEAAETQAAQLTESSSEELQTLQQQLQQYQELIVSGKTKLEQLEAEIESLTREKQETEELILSEKSKSSQQEAEIETLTKEKQEAQDLMESGKARLEELQSQIETLNKEKEEAKDIVESGKAQLERQQQEIESLTTQWEETKKSSSEQTEQYRQQVEELESQLHGVNENVERLEKELQAAITRAESAEAQAAALSSGGSEEVKTLQHKLQETQSCLEHVKAENDRYYFMLGDLEKELSAAQQELETEKHKVKDLEALAQKAQETLENEKKRFESQVHGVSENVERLEKELQAAITRAESAEAQAAALSSGGSEEVKTLQHKLQETQSCLEHVKTENDHYYFMLGDLEKELSAAQQELETDKHKVKDLEVRAQTAEETLENEKKRFEEDLASNQQEMQYYKDVIDEVEKELAETKEHLHQEMQKKSTASSGDDSSENTVELQKRYEKAKQQVSKLHSHLWKLDASHKKASATQQQTIADLEGKVKQLQDDLAARASMCQSAEECATLRTNVVDMRLRINALETEILRDSEPLKERIKSLTKYQAELQKVCYHQKSELRKLRNQLDESIACPRCAEGKPAGNDMAENFRQQFLAESEKTEMNNQIKNLTSRLKQRDEDLQTAKVHCSQLEDKVKKFDRFSRKLRDERDKAVLKEILNSNKENQMDQSSTEEQPAQCKSQ